MHEKFAHRESLIGSDIGSLLGFASNTVSSYRVYVYLHSMSFTGRECLSSWGVKSMNVIQTGLS